MGRPTRSSAAGTIDEMKAWNYRKREGPWPGNRVLYIDVEDLAAYRKKAVAAGADGRMMGLWKSKS